MQFVELWNELISIVPALPPRLAQRCVQRAWLEVRDARNWSWLAAEAVVQTPAQIATGIFSVTKGSVTVTPNAQALAAITGIVDLARRQIRFGGAGPSPIYNIAGFDGPVVTLDRPYLETSDAAAQYRIFKCYYSPPAGFLRWTSVVDAGQSYRLATGFTSEHLDWADPQRGDAGEPYIIAFHRSVPAGFWDANVSAGDPLYEFWPHPLAERSYRVLYQRRGTDFTSPSDRLPSVIAEELVVLASRIRAYGLGLTLEDAARRDYKTALAVAKAEYKSALVDAKRQDDGLALKTYWREWEHLRTHPLTASFVQRHALAYR